MKQVGVFFIVSIGNEFQFPLLDTVHCGTESEHQVLNGSLIFNSFTRIFVLFGTTFQYSRKRRQDEERKQSDKAAIRQLVLTFRHTMRCRLHRKLKLLMPVSFRCAFSFIVTAEMFYFFSFFKFNACPLISCRTRRQLLKISIFIKLLYLLYRT